ncbi:MAG: NAD(P)/FAD-dependent oxidoreductase, partial [Rhodospirillales bacterium]|nr:NAD(P)/FAD-dependent oxidoreductase [Rhodospirillales bacterium]
TRAGEEVIEAIFCFETKLGQGSGVLRLLPSSKNNHPLKAWTFVTVLDQLSGFGEQLGRKRPKGDAYSRDFQGPNWLDERNTAIAYADRDPAVLVVGGGQAGLSIAARLRQLNVDTLIVDLEKRIGDNWRSRYHRLTLHNQLHVNHLPYMPFPPSWPAYIPKDKLANWFEAYAESMELNFWTETEFRGGAYDHNKKKWSVVLHKDGCETRKIHPRHIIMATGVSGVPKLPDIPSLQQFGGQVIHSSGYKNGKDWEGSRVLIIGSGTSGHDIAQDLYSNNADVTLVQRSPTTIVDIEPSAQLPYALYDEGPPIEDCDLISASTPFQLLKRSHQLITEQTKIFDKELLNGLSNVGFELDFGEDDTGWQFKYLRRGGGYYFNVGCSNLIVERKVRLVQFSEIDGLISDGVEFKNGDRLKLDLVVLATGFEGQEFIIKEMFGAKIADSVGPIWGFNSQQQELRNMWVRTGQAGLWFIAGSFAQCRIYSKFLGLQIKACEEGLIPLTH